MVTFIPPAPVGAPIRHRVSPAVPRMLVVEDDTLLTLLIQAIVDGSRDVAHTPTADEALGIVRREHPSLVLADLLLPGMRGDELCRRIKSDPATAGITVILTSGWTPAEVLDLAHAAGADDFLPKPFGVVGLLTLLRRSAGV
jgi:CheY-like chemotaxis protein